MLVIVNRRVAMRRVVCVFMAAFVCGCGGPAGPETAPVTGKVTMNGSTVADGRVMFYPVVSPGTDAGKNTGKYAQGQLDADGNFVLSTYSDGDGAVIGEHTITVLTNRIQGVETGETRPKGVANPERVTVESGKDNHFEIVLTEAKRQGDAAEIDDDD